MASEIDTSDSPPFLPMEAKAVDALPDEPGWLFEPKWDGFRCLAIRNGAEARIFAKSGKPLGRFFPEVIANLAAIPETDFVLDGELVIPNGGFEALGMRLHPAESRIKRLAGEIPALLVAFDLPVAPGHRDLRAEPLTARRAALTALLDPEPEGFRLSPSTTDRTEAARWLELGHGSVDGVVAKRLDGRYAPEERAMRKIKRIRSADCVVGGFRYGTGSKYVASLLLGLYDAEGKLNHVGFTSQISKAEAPALTEKLEALRGEGFTGNAPGGPSRWSTERTSTYVPLRHELVVEVLYDHITGGRFRHGSRLHRWRPDKAPSQCTYDQLAPAGTLPAGIANILSPRA